MVLAVPAGLGALVAEGRGRVPGLPGQRRVVLDEGPHHGGRALGAQGQDPAAAVLELVHLLAHHVAALADAPAEDADVLEDRGVARP